MNGGARPVLAALTETTLWWGAATGIWLLTLSSVSWPDLAAALACGVPCALAARGGRRAMRASWRPRIGWVRWLVPLPAAVTADTGRVLAAAARGRGREPLAGELREVALPATEPPATAAARRALASLLLSSTPGTLVLDSYPEDDMLVTHRLAGGWPGLDRVVSR